MERIQEEQKCPRCGGSLKQSLLGMKSRFIHSAVCKKAFLGKIVSLLLHLISFVRSQKDNIPQEGEGFKYVTKPYPHVLIQSQSLCPKVFLQPTKRPKSLGLGDLFQRWLGHCLGCLDTENPAWAGIKKIFVPLFRMQKIDDDTLIKEWDQELRLLCQQSKSTEKPVSIEAVVADLPLKYILRKIFGTTFMQEHKEEFQNVQESASFLMFQVFNDNLSKWKFYRFLPTQTNNVLKNFERRWNLLLKKAKQSESVKNEGLYWELFSNYEEAKGLISYKMFSQTLAEIVYANKDVVLPSAAWLLTHYTLYPSFDNAAHFIEESARLSPVFPTSMPKITTKEIILGDNVVIPKGTTVVMDNVALGYSSDWKMDDLNVFRHERHNDHTIQNMITRFGYGGRRCPGGRLANNLFTKMLEHLKQNWHLVPSHPTKLDSIKKDPSRPFNTPLFDVWIVQKEETFRPNPDSLYYDCPPEAEKTERAFMAISINRRSPFLKDQKKVDMAVQRLAERPVESVILLADDIARFNIQAFDHRKPDKARKEAQELGNKFAEKFEQSIKEFGQGRVTLIRWADLNLSENIDESLRVSPELNSRVSSIARTYLDNRGQGKINNSYEERIKLGARYILSEIPVLICGIRYQDKWYRLLYYCGSIDHLSKFAEDEGSLHTLTLDIISKPEFATIKEEISALVGSHKLYKVPGFIGIDIGKAN